MYILNSIAGYCIAADGKFTTAKLLVPRCLDMCDTNTIRRFFRKMWHYMDAYSYVLHSFVCYITHCVLYFTARDWMHRRLRLLSKSTSRIAALGPRVRSSDKCDSSECNTPPRMHPPTLQVSLTFIPGPPAQKLCFCGHVSNFGDDFFFENRLNVIRTQFST